METNTKVSSMITSLMDGVNLLAQQIKMFIGVCLKKESKTGLEGRSVKMKYAFSIMNKGKKNHQLKRANNRNGSGPIYKRKLKNSKKK